MVLDTSDVEVDPVRLGVELATWGARVFGVPAAEGLLNLMLIDVGAVLDEVPEGEN